MRINKQLCDICGSCVAVCPVDAITVKEFAVEINPEVCISCGKCMQVCPAGAIEEK